MICGTEGGQYRGFHLRVTSLPSCLAFMFPLCDRYAQLLGLGVVGGALGRHCALERSVDDGTGEVRQVQQRTSSHRMALSLFSNASSLRVPFGQGTCYADPHTRFSAPFLFCRTRMFGDLDHASQICFAMSNPAFKSLNGMLRTSWYSLTAIVIPIRSISSIACRFREGVVPGHPLRVRCLCR